MRRIITVVASLVLIVFVAIATTSVQHKEGKAPRPKKLDKQKEKERVSHIKRGLGEGHHKITGLVTDSPGDVFVRREIGMPMLSPNPTAFDFTSFLNQMVSDADAVVVGTVESKLSHLTEDGTFVYTDYELAVDEVVKNNVDAPIELNSRINASRPGGTIQLVGKNVVADDRAFKRLELNEKYLLFLTYIPEKNEYAAYSSTGSFLLRDNKVFNLTDEHLPAEIKNINDAAAFLSLVRAASANVTSNEIEGGANE